MVKVFATVLCRVKLLNFLLLHLYGLILPDLVLFTSPCPFGLLRSFE